MPRFCRVIESIFYGAALLAALLMIGYVAFAFSARRASATDFLDWSPRATERYGRAKVNHHRRWSRPARKRVEERRDYADMRLYRSVDDVVCGGKTRGLGTQWIGTEGAMDAAKKDWMERVRYDLGEAFLDLTHARDFVSRCGRTSIGETMGQVMYRCEIVARPCKGDFTEGNAAKKD